MHQLVLPFKLFSGAVNRGGAAVALGPPQDDAYRVNGRTRPGIIGLAANGAFNARCSTVFDRLA